MRLQRRLYWIYTALFLIYTIPCNCNLISFLAKSLNKPLKGYRGRGGCSQGFGVLPGFWSCSRGFGVKIGNLSEKSFKKGTFKPKINIRRRFIFTLGSSYLRDLILFTVSSVVGNPVCSLYKKTFFKQNKTKFFYNDHKPI